MQTKTVLVVFAHPEPTSFSGALRDTVVASMKGNGFNVIQSDLYSQKFNPVLSADDYLNHDRNEPLRVISAQVQALKELKLAKEVQDELDKLHQADYVITVSPFWWSGFPAILKGWLDRVFVCGEGGAWSFTQSFKNGVFQGKKVLNILVVGSPAQSYTPEGPHRQDFLERIKHVTIGGFQFVGFDVIEPLHFHSVGKQSEEERKNYLDQAAEYVKNLEKAPLLYKY